MEEEKWESEKNKNWSMPAEGFKGHVATDGSLLGTAGKWGACGWSVVQLDSDEELWLLHGMYDSMGAELEVQRTFKIALLCLFKNSDWTIEVHVDNKGIIDRLWSWFSHSALFCLVGQSSVGPVWRSCD